MNPEQILSLLAMLTDTISSLSQQVQSLTQENEDLKKGIANDSDV